MLDYEKHAQAARLLAASVRMAFRWGLSDPRSAEVLERCLNNYDAAYEAEFIEPMRTENS